MSRLINIGFGNMVNASKIVAIISPDSAPSKRIVQNAKDEGRAIDATQGRRSRAVIIMTDDHVVLSALQPETIAGRYQGREIQEQTIDTEKMRKRRDQKRGILTIISGFSGAGKELLSQTSLRST